MYFDRICNLSGLSNFILFLISKLDLVFGSQYQNLDLVVHMYFTLESGIDVGQGINVKNVGQGTNVKKSAGSQSARSQSTGSQSARSQSAGSQSAGS